MGGPERALALAVGGVLLGTLVVMLAVIAKERMREEGAPDHNSRDDESGDA
jgi:hypothetical protein